jgi:nucleoside-diphosphate-sugar epimerase
MERLKLVTGVGSGLGHAVHRLLGGMAFSRGTKLGDVSRPARQPYDAIIHCAVNATKTVTMANVHRYLEDNLLLTQELLKIPHRRFVFISTVDLYPKPSLAPARVEDDLDLAQVSGLYASTKLFSEALVRAYGERPLILRPTTLMGPVMRPNSTYRMLTEPHCRLFLSSRSRFNFVLHRDVAQFIDYCLKHDIAGTYNIASATTTTLGEIAEQLQLSVEFGSHDYDVGLIDQSDAASLCSGFARPTWQTLNAFIDDLGPLYVGKGRLSSREPVVEAA